MHGAQRMMKPGMQSARVNKIAEAQLFYIPQPLKVRMLNQVMDQITLYGDESVDRVVNDFLFIQSIN